MRRCDSRSSSCPWRIAVVTRRRPLLPRNSTTSTTLRAFLHGGTFHLRASTIAIPRRLIFLRLPFPASPSPDYPPLCSLLYHILGVFLDGGARIDAVAVALTLVSARIQRQTTEQPASLVLRMLHAARAFFPRCHACILFCLHNSLLRLPRCAHTSSQPHR